MNKVSIIIPVYNCEKYIYDCICSVLNQTYNNIEIIVVDDGSTDKTNDYLQLFKDDKRVVIYNNSNHGVSYSRNFAIKKCTGDYITFVDADDIVSNDFIDELIRCIQYEDAELAAVEVVKNNILHLNDFTNGSMNVISGQSIIDGLFELYEGFVCNKLYIRKIIEERSILFNESLGVGEDLLFNYVYLSKCKKVIYNQGKKYFYRQNSNSAINDLKNIKWFDILKVYKTIIKIMGEDNNYNTKVIYNYKMLLFEAKYRLKYVEKKDSYKLSRFIEKELETLDQYNNKIGLKKCFKLFIFHHFPRLVMIYRRRQL